MSIFSFCVSVYDIIVSNSTIGDQTNEKQKKEKREENGMVAAFVFHYG